MLRLTLARDQLLCGYGSHMDPSIDLRFSGEHGLGCRPSMFFGPKRDALNLITQKLQAALIIRPRTLADLSPRLYVLTLPGGYLEVEGLWREQAQALAGQIKPKLILGEWQQSQSELEADADIYHQEFFPVGKDLPPELRELRLCIDAVIEADALRERWQVKGLHEQHFEAHLVYWYEPEIGAATQMQSTIFYEPQAALSSFRGSVCFSLQALQGKQTLPVAFAECGAWQQQRAAARFGELLRSFWYRDELLGMAYAGRTQSQSSWLPLEPHSLASLGQTDGLVCWRVPGDSSFELRFRLSLSFDQLSEPLTELAQVFEQQRARDQSWLKGKKAAPKHLSAALEKSYQRTLLTLKQMQDPAGGIIAAPEFHYRLSNCGGYAFCWGRDAGFISYAMDVCGMFEESAQFYRYMQRCQSADGSFLHRHDMDGQLGASWGLLQPDETASVVFGFWQHVRLAENRAIAEELRSMIDRATHWLCNSRHPNDPHLPIPGFDLWEEREGIHYYSVAAMAAGVKAAIDLYRYMSWAIPEAWQKRCDELIALCNSNRFIKQDAQGTRFARSLFRRIPSHMRHLIEQQGEELQLSHSSSGRPQYALTQDYVVDISQLAAHYPYQVLDLKQHGQAYQDLLQQVMARLWRPDIGGIGRYEADHYRDGNPWVLTTIWLALAAVHAYPAEQRLSAEQLRLARTAWQWVIAHMPAEGQLPEQIDPVNGRPSWVMPLTWSHAMFALAIQQLPPEVLA